MNKMSVIAIAVALVLGGCGEKDAEYYYNHPEELKQVGMECEAKAKAASDDELADLTNDETCKNAMLAAAGINMGDLKKAIIASDKVGWEKYLEHVKEQRKYQREVEAANKAQLEKKAAEEKADEEAAQKLIEQSEQQTWVEFLKDKPAYSSCRRGTKLCETTDTLIQEKTREGLEALQNTDYQDLVKSKSKYCATDIERNSKVLCSIWFKAEEIKKSSLINDYINDEQKLRADYQSCYDNVHQYEEYSTNAETNRKREEAKQSWPCPIVGEAAAKKYDNIYFTQFRSEIK